MFWKKNSKNADELAQKLMLSEADCSFLNSQFDSSLATLISKRKDDADLQKSYLDFIQDISQAEPGERWSIEKEFNLLNQYITLYTSLLQDEIHLRVEEHIEDKQMDIPCLILFPLLQNALKCGYNSMEQYPLKLKIKAKDQVILVDVSNRVNHYLVNQAEDLALKRFESRLIKEFGEDYNLLINSNSNVFKMSLRIVLKK